MTTTQITIDELFNDIEVSQRNNFRAYHAKYPQVYQRFRELTLDCIRRGHHHFSARGIFQVARYMHSGEIKADGFKYNTNYTPYYARMFENEHPQYKGFFEKRKVKQEL